MTALGGFETAVFDEAAQAGEPATLVPLQHGCRRVVLVGTATAGDGPLSRRSGSAWPSRLERLGLRPPGAHADDAVPDAPCHTRLPVGALLWEPVDGRRQRENGRGALARLRRRPAGVFAIDTLPEVRRAYVFFNLRSGQHRSEGGGNHSLYNAAEAAFCAAHRGARATQGEWRRVCERAARRPPPASTTTAATAAAMVAATRAGHDRGRCGRRGWRGRRDDGGRGGGEEEEKEEVEEGELEGECSDDADDGTTQAQGAPPPQPRRQRNGDGGGPGRGGGAAAPSSSAAAAATPSRAGRPGTGPSAASTLCAGALRSSRRTMRSAASSARLRARRRRGRPRGARHLQHRHSRAARPASCVLVRALGRQVGRARLRQRPAPAQRGADARATLPLSARRRRYGRRPTGARCSTTRARAAACATSTPRTARRAATPCPRHDPDDNARRHAVPACRTRASLRLVAIDRAGSERAAFRMMLSAALLSLPWGPPPYRVEARAPELTWSRGGCSSRLLYNWCNRDFVNKRYSMCDIFRFAPLHLVNRARAKPEIN